MNTELKTKYLGIDKCIELLQNEKISFAQFIRFQDSDTEEAYIDFCIEKGIDPDYDDSAREWFAHCNEMSAYMSDWPNDLV